MLKRLYADESGISLVEVLLAAAMASIIATAFLVVFSAFSRNVSLEEARASALTDVQQAMAELTSELRQAIPLAAGDPVIEVLDSSWATAELIFYSDRANAPGPERYRYYLANCTAVHCDLMRDLTVADAAGAPWTYSGTPNTELMVPNLLIGGDPLFAGAEWSSGSEIATTDCDTATPCEFSLVEIIIRADPDPNLLAEEPLRVRQNVRLRNA
jgi:type II secretory pathway pseudopilin PulG